MDAFIQDTVLMAKPALFNIYFALASIPLGFPLALLLAFGKLHRNAFIALPARGFIYAFRGSPLFIQFFMFYSIALALNSSVWRPLGIDWLILNPLFLGPFVLILNTSAYSAEIFAGALRNIPKGEIEAARAVGMSQWQEFRTVTWPNMMRIAWPAYTNEMVFLFHATALVYFTLPVINDQADLMRKARELFERDYNIMLHFSVAAIYFLVISIILFFLANQVYKYLNRHLSSDTKVKKLRIKPNYAR